MPATMWVRSAEGRIGAQEYAAKKFVVNPVKKSRSVWA